MFYDLVIIKLEIMLKSWRYILLNSIFRKTELTASPNLFAAAFMFETAINNPWNPLDSLLANMMHAIFRNCYISNKLYLIFCI